jgi:hypothetical protein
MTVEPEKKVFDREALIEELREQNDKKLFSRKNLWIGIVVLIPLIQILNYFGQDHDHLHTPDTVIEHFNLSELTLKEYDNDHYKTYYSPLDSDALVIGIAIDQIPAAIPTIDHDTFKTGIQNNYFYTQFTMQLNDQAVLDTLDFMADWLPPFNEKTKLVIVGPVNEKTIKWIQSRLNRNLGTTIERRAELPQALTLVELPKMGSKDMSLFLIANGILSQRLAGYDVQVEYNFKNETAYLMINATIDQQLLFEISDDEFNLSLAQYQQGAMKLRNVNQITASLLKMANYGLSTEFITEQHLRFDNIRKEDVNQMLLDSFKL